MPRAAAARGAQDPRLIVRWVVSSLAALALASPALAQPLGVTAEVERPIASTGGEDPTASATEVDARRRPTELDTLESALLEVPGARPLATGAYGSATSLALRGADADQLEVLFGDLPITTADGGAFDLSTVPLWALERVEVYRSGAPTWLGGGGIGGLVRLVPRTGERTSVSGTVGVGSFGLAHGRLAASAGDGALEWTSAAGVTSSEGDFPYLEDRTPLDPTDGVERARSNGWLREGSAFGHLRARVLGGRLSVLGFGLERVGGVPGPALHPTLDPRRVETTLLAAAGYELAEGGRDPAWRLSVSTSGAYRRRRFTDRFGEIGLARATDDGQWRSVVRVAASGRALSWLELTGVALYVREELAPRDALARQPNAGSARDAGTFALEARSFGRIDGVRLELRPSARLAVIGSRLTELRPERAGDEAESLIAAPTFRLAGVVEPVRGLAISASAASATRAPSMIELFGDRGYLLGDTRLSPERAETFDLGVALRGRQGELAGAAELRGFVTLASDLIRYRRTAQHTAVPENVASALLYGAELGVSGRLTRHVTLAGALTLLDTRTEYLGNPQRLPLRPWITAYVRPAVSAFGLGPLDRAELWADVSYVGENALDPANSATLPARARVGIGLSLYTGGARMRVDLAVRDLFDQRGTDLMGFPLPGRSFSAALTLASD